MSIEQASAFLDDWVNENVHAVAHPKDNTEAMQLASRCLEAAEAHGITKSELEEAAGEDLVKCMCISSGRCGCLYRRIGGRRHDLKSD